MSQDSARACTDEQSSLLEAALDAAANAIVITNNRGEIQWVNSAFSRLTGYEASEVIGKNPRILKSGTHEVSFYQELWRTILDGRVWHGELLNRRKDGSVYSEEQTITPVRNEQGGITHFIAIKQDITERKLLEKQLQLGQKMQAVGQLAAGVAHDFNNILNVILGYSELTLRKLPEADPLRAHVREVHAAGERAASLTRQLLAFSRQQVLQPRVLDVNVVIGESEKLLRRLLPEDVELSLTLRGNLGRVMADPSQIEQVMMNLVINARDAIVGRGRISIETSDVNLDETYARLHPPLKPGRFVVVVVSDTGAGMDAATQARIFEPFFSTKGIGKGTGLGLATVYGIVKQSGGFVWVYSEPGIGSTFKVYLPHSVQQAGAVHAAAAPVAPAHGVETVLFVEDEPSLRRLGRLTLEASGFTVIEAADGREALELARREGSRIHIVVTDVIMPTMSGNDLVQHLSKNWPGMKALYVSGYTDDTIARRGVLSQGSAFLQKPYSAAGLVHKVRETLDTGKTCPVE